MEFLSFTRRSLPGRRLRSNLPRGSFAGQDAHPRDCTADRVVPQYHQEVSAGGDRQPPVSDTGAAEQAGPVCREPVRLASDRPAQVAQGLAHRQSALRDLAFGNALSDEGCTLIWFSLAMTALMSGSQ